MLFRILFPLLMMGIGAVLSLLIATPAIVVLFGCLGGAALGGLLLVGHSVVRRLQLRRFGAIVTGVIIGCLLAQALLWLVNTTVSLTSLNPLFAPIVATKFILITISLYIGVAVVTRAGDQWVLQLPFVRLSETTTRQRELVLDRSVLSDPRLLDLAATGLLDRRCVLPHFVLAELQGQQASSEEFSSRRARQSLEVVRRLEQLPRLGLRIDKTTSAGVAGYQGELARLARLLDADILTAESSRMEPKGAEDARFVNLHTLSKALKPLMQRGELLDLCIQRSGNEPRQGVGYLQDGTMVVVNGGGDYIGEEVRTQVLSVTHTASGRMIFCNVARDMDEEE